MFNTLKKTSLALLVASTALVQMSCSKNEDAEKLGNWFRKDLPSFGGSSRTNAVSFVIGDVISGHTTQKLKSGRSPRLSQAPVATMQRRLL
jgi:hypothetical protein